MNVVLSEIQSLLYSRLKSGDKLAGGGGGGGRNLPSEKGLRRCITKQFLSYSDLF